MLLRRVVQSRRGLGLLGYKNIRNSKAITSSSTRKYSTQIDRMEEQPFEKMEEHGVPKCPEPTKVATAPKKEEKKDDLAKLTPKEFRQYNHMAEHMDMFHENFRRTWNTLYTAASAGKRPNGMSIKQYLNTISQFTHHLTIHHTIEEQHIFPILAKRMDVFKAKGGRHLEQHEKIHEGIESMEEYVEGVRSGERELDLREVKGVMDSFGGVLWTHLDEEVRTLGAENMRLFWSLEEMARMPM